MMLLRDTGDSSVGGLGTREPLFPDTAFASSSCGDEGLP